MLDFMDESVDSLCNTNRWETYSVIKKNSVAQHSFVVAHIAYQIALSEDDVDEDEVVKRALFHDFEECYTGDLPRFSKRGNDEFEDILEEVEEDAMDELLDNSHMDKKSSKEIRNLWNNSKDDSPEGQVIRQADILSAVYDIYREINRGNKKIKEYEDVVKGIEYAIEICDGTPVAEEFLRQMLEKIGWEDEGFEE